MSKSLRHVAASMAATPIRSAVFAVLVAGASASIPAIAFAADGAAAKPTVLLVHGAFAESASWDKVSARLLAKGYAVVAAANPLRSVKGDGAYVADLVDSI